MLENRKISLVLVGYIIGIFMGLYCKISIVLFYLLFYLVYLIFYKKEQFAKKKHTDLIEENKSFFEQKNTFVVKQNKFSKRNFKLISFKRYFRYVKVVFNKKVIKIIIISSIISNVVVLYQNYKYENLYKNFDGKNIGITGIVVSCENNKYKVKVKTGNLSNTFLEAYVKDQKLNYGDKILINGKYMLPQKRKNYKGFDYSAFLKTRKIYGLVYANKVNIISKDNGFWLLRYTNKLSAKCKSIINNASMNEDEKALIKGILLGDKTDISEEIINNFSESNISYILAISGMHISYIIILSSFIFNKLAGKHYSKLITSFIIFIYMCMVNFSASVVRAGITGIVALMSNFFYMRKDTWEALSLPLLILLIYNPFLIANVGVELSFAGTIGIIVLQPIFNKFIIDYLDRRKRNAIRKNKVIIKFLINILNTKIMILIKDAILLTISASIAIIPIMAINFNKISFTSLLISVITGFLIGEIVILGLAFIVFKIKIIQKILSIFLNMLLGVAKLGEKLSLNQIYLITPSIIQVIIYYFLIFIISCILKINLQKNRTVFQKRIMNLVSLAKYKFKLNKRKIISIILIINIISFFISIIPKNLKIYFIDVGQGDSCLIVTPRNKTILVDGGGSESFDVRKKYFNAIFTR